MNIGYIGLGIMGKPCVLNLLKAGHQVTIWARRRESAEPLLAAGAQWADSPAALTGAVDLLITNLPDTPDVEAVLCDEAGVFGALKSGQIVADMSTISPIGARRVAVKLAEKEVKFIDCPVSGGEIGAINATLTFMVGGDAEALATIRPALEAMGKSITRVGDSGAGQVAKACNQIAVGVTVMAVAEVMKLARACDVDLAAVRAALMGGFAQSRVLDVHGQRMIDDAFPAGFKATLHLKDMNIVLDTARELGIRLPESERMTELIRELIDQGDGDLDSSAIARLIWAKN
ncbi:NAD(P)-dependent oxidoreductase [Crenobacter sp. SG2303]|uniref:NAD(P)-dependent oxidoreductase n=1 Tax=Crenobacter oryzisoli TaxID=3056844 RepID=A0ABT7XPX4_9NEIS|nr:NAD(P)-dependent oxidoreductase [Crenobacter sp. SG2303]MDN0075843.1 NAD(P)-dependent oxidoreductase [Crenobacter sp. SG2303]